MKNRTFPRHPKGYGHWRLDVTRVADRQWKAGINRVMGHPIGVFVVLGDYLYGVCKPISGADRRAKQAGKL